MNSFLKRLQDLENKLPPPENKMTIFYADGHSFEVGALDCIHYIADEENCKLPPSKRIIDIVNGEGETSSLFMAIVNSTWEDIPELDNPPQDDPD